MSRLRPVLWLTLVGLMTASGIPAAHAAGARAGDAVVVEGQGSSLGRSSGGSATVFSLKLPRNASCPGDSADDNYRVQSYLVPESSDPATLRYKSQGPDAPGGWALYKVNTSAYIQEQTANAEQPGEPGAVLDLPDLSFKVWEGADPLVGRYHVGVACALLNETVTYWGTEMVFTEDQSDEPAGFRWRVVSDAQESADTGGASGGQVPTLVLAAAALGALFIFGRSRAGARSKARA